MKNKITILGEEYFYNLGYDCNEFGDYEWTDFYKEVTIHTRKKYLLFGPIISFERPIILFTAYFWITDVNITKAKLKELLEEKVTEYRGLKNRKEEIKNGELI